MKFYRFVLASLAVGVVFLILLDGNPQLFQKEASGQSTSDWTNNTYWHDIFEVNGVSFGSLGALVHILNNQSEPISCGFHSIKKVDGGYTANIGSLVFTLNNKGQIIASKSDDYKAIGLTCPFIVD